MVDRFEPVVDHRSLVDAAAQPGRGPGPSTVTGERQHHAGGGLGLEREGHRSSPARRRHTVKALCTPSSWKP